MKFSIVIPTYNRADIIEKSLDSIYNQTYPDWEIIVVDNASTDNTREIMEKYLKRGKIRYIINDKNYERSYSRNRGISLSNGDFITLLDSDDILYNDCLNKAAEYIIKNPDTSFFYCLAELLDKNYKPIKRDGYFSIKNPFKSIAKGNFISNIGAFYSKDLLGKVKFDEDPVLIGIEDYDFVLNVLLHNNKVGRIDEYCCGIYNHAGRSVHHEEWGRTKNRVQYFINKQLTNPLFKQKMKLHKASFLAHLDLYLASFSATRHKTSKAFKYIFKSFIKYPLIVTETTFWKHIFVTIKNIF